MGAGDAEGLDVCFRSGEGPMDPLQTIIYFNIFNSSCCQFDGTRHPPRSQASHAAWPKAVRRNGSHHFGGGRCHGVHEVLEVEAGLASRGADSPGNGSRISGHRVSHKTTRPLAVGLEVLDACGAEVG